MMKTMKRLGCLLLVLAMCLALGVSVFAAGASVNATITITDVSYTDQTFTAYQIFEGTASSDGNTLSDIDWGSAIDTTKKISGIKYGGTSEELDIYGALAAITLGDTTRPFVGCESAAEIAAVLEECTNGGSVDDSEITQMFAKIVALFIADDAQGASSSIIGEDDGAGNIVPTQTGTDADNNPTYSYVIEIDEAGYYLVMNTDGHQLDKAEQHTEFILQIIGDGNTMVEVKETPPTVDKSITGVLDENGEERESNIATGADDANASVGDTIEYTLTINVPNLSDYDSYFLNVQDKLSAGLTLNDYDKADGYSPVITITITDGNDAEHVLTTDSSVTGANGTGYNALTSSNGTTWTYIDDWTTPTDAGDEYFLYGIYTDANGNTTLYVAIYNYLQYGQDGASVVTVEYSATLNENAVIGNTGNENDVKLIYPNDPTYDYGGMIIPGDNPDAPVGKTPEQKTYMFTTGIAITKIDGNTEDALTGAAFTLTGKGVNAIVTFAEEYEKRSSGTWYGLKANAEDTEPSSWTLKAPTESMGESNLALYMGYDSTKDFDEQEWTMYSMEYSTKVTGMTNNTASEGIEVYVDSNGVAYFYGLGAGEYKLEETVVPDGYNKMADISFTINWEPTTDASRCTWFITDVTGATVDDFDYDQETGIFSITIVNNQGTKLPGTGGIGTTIFYMIGAVLVCGAVVLLVTKRRVKNNQPET